MARIDLEKYINELRNFETGEKELDLYSIKKEISNLNKHSEAFDNFEKETMVIDGGLLRQIENLNSLIKIRSLASEIKNKKQINDKLHSLHFHLTILKNKPIPSDISPIKNTINFFLIDDNTKIDSLINELNEFKSKLDEIKKYQSHLLPKSLDNKLKIENKYNKHIEQLHLIHKKQKNALISTIKLFLKLTKKHIKNLKKFK